MMRAIVLSCAAMLALGACLEETAPGPQAADQTDQDVAGGQVAGAPPADDPVVQPTSAGPQQVESQIDWEAARQARAQPAVTDSNVSIQSTTDGAPAAVPMLLPSGVVTPQNARPPAVVTTDDGYFATYQTLRYDAIVNGTKNAYDTGAPAADKEAMRFTQGEGGAQLAFSRFGADYLIEFECREIDGGESCITEDEALEFAESLFVAQTQ